MKAIVFSQVVGLGGGTAVATIAAVARHAFFPWIPVPIMAAGVAISAFAITAGALLYAIRRWRRE